MDKTYEYSFDENSTKFDKDKPRWNYFYLKAVQDYFTKLLRETGWVYLKDILTHLGIEIKETDRDVVLVHEDVYSYVSLGLNTLENRAAYREKGKPILLKIRT